jgi:hypothetical protein
LDQRILDVAADHCADYGQGERVIGINLLELLAFVPPDDIREAMNGRLADIFAPTGVDVWRVDNWDALHNQRASASCHD